MNTPVVVIANATNSSGLNLTIRQNAESGFSTGYQYNVSGVSKWHVLNKGPGILRCKNKLILYPCKLATFLKSLQIRMNLKLNHEAKG